MVEPTVLVSKQESGTGSGNSPTDRRIIIYFALGTRRSRSPVGFLSLFLSTRPEQRHTHFLNSFPEIPPSTKVEDGRKRFRAKLRTPSASLFWFSRSICESCARDDARGSPRLLPAVLSLGLLNEHIEHRSGAMSGSTAAAVAATPVTSNGASLTLDATGKPDARRRTMVIVEKTLNADGLSAGGTNGVANGKDLSHTIRGESVIERPKDYSKLKKRLIASSTVSPRRKKAVPKPEKPKWQTVLSVLTKNCLLLAALLWLGQTVWRWSYSIGDNANSPFASLDYESRIYDVEASIKETAKMLQVQLDVVDKKIGSEIGIVTRELLKQAEEKGALFEEELKKLEAKTDSLDKSLGELKDKGLLSREEFEKLLNGLDDSNINLDLDQIRAFARDIVQKEIEKHAADGLGRVDYALASGGAKVVRHSEPYGFGKGNTWFARGHNGVHANAHKMLEPSFGEPGQCFPLQGSSGFVELRLRTGIIPEAVTLEHVAKSVAYDRSSAPKDCRVSAWFESPDEDPSSNIKKIVMLTEFSYDLEKSNAQTFDVMVGDAGVVINTVRLDFTSNHGSSALTCIYRFRVHGHEPSSPAAMGLQG